MGRTWVREREAAEYLGVSASILAKWRCTGAGPTFSRRQRVILYAVEDLDAWARDGRVRSTTEADQRDGRLKRPTRRKKAAGAGQVLAAAP